jgi:hypothetical protein
MTSRRMLELIIAIVLPASSLAQPVIHIDDAKGCAGCTVRMRKMTVLSGEDETGLPRHPQTIVRDSRGRVFTGYGDASVLPRVFGPDGKLIQTFLRKGSGPNELEFVDGMLLLGGDSLMLMNRKNMYIFDPELQVARTLPAPNRFSSGTSISGGRSVLMRGGNMQTLTERIAIVDNMGADISEMDIKVSAKGADSYTRMAAGQEDSFWWLMSAEYDVQRWGTNGKRLLTIQRNAPWWSDGTGLQRNKPMGVRAPVSITDVREDGQGHLWIIAAVPRRTLAVSDTAGLQGDPPPYVLYDTMIEILDSRTGKLLVSERVAGYFSHLLGANHLSKLVDDADGHPLVEIWKADLLGVR